MSRLITMEEHKKFRKDPRVPTKHTPATCPLHAQRSTIPQPSRSVYSDAMWTALWGHFHPRALQGVSSSSLGVLRGTAPFPALPPS